MALGRERTRQEWPVASHVVVASVLVAMGALVFVLVRPDATAGERLAVTGLAVVALAALEVYWHPDRRLIALGPILVASLGFVGGAWFAVARLGVQWASVAMLVVAALALYLLSRYQLVVLNLEEGDR